MTEKAYEHTFIRRLLNRLLLFPSAPVWIGLACTCSPGTDASPASPTPIHHRAERSAVPGFSLRRGELGEERAGTR